MQWNHRGERGEKNSGRWEIRKLIFSRGQLTWENLAAINGKEFAPKVAATFSLKPILEDALNTAASQLTEKAKLQDFFAPEESWKIQEGFSEIMSGSD